MTHYCTNLFLLYKEEKDVIQVTVVRSGSAIVSAAIQYFLEPNGDNKFYGGSNVLYFQPTETTKRVAIVAKDDGVPQVQVLAGMIITIPSLCRSHSGMKLRMVLLLICKKYVLQLYFKSACNLF